METPESEVLVSELENRVDRLRALYEQYFLGFEKLEPLVVKKDVERRFDVLRRAQLRNTALRFRFSMVQQRYNTFLSYWIRICRQIEEGTYKRHLMRAKGKGAAAANPGEEVAWEIDVEFEDELAAEEAAPDSDDDFDDRDTDRPPPMLTSEDPFAGITATATFRREPDGSFLTAARQSLKAPTGDFQRPKIARRDDPLSPPTPLAAHAPAGPASGRLPVAAPPPSTRLPVAAPPPSARLPVAPPASDSEQRLPRVAAQGNLMGGDTQPLRRVAAPVIRRAELGGATPDAMPAPAAKAPVAPPSATARPAVRPQLTSDTQREFRPMPIARAVAARPAAEAPSVPKAAAPASAPKAAAPASAPKAAAPAAAPRDPAMSDARIRELYTKYVQEKRSRNESTAQITYDTVAKSLRESSAKLKQKHGDKAVDFEVAQKDGKTILKPVVR